MTPMDNGTALERQLRGYRLTTAEILYHMPDHPGILQTFSIQRYDLAPDYPELKRFLAFWETEIEAKIHSVRVATRALIGGAEVRVVRSAGFLH